MRSRPLALFFFTQTRYAFKTLTAPLRRRSAITGRSTVKPYVFSLLAGILAGVIYGAIGVNSPAPPIIALTGLLGMLAGEQILPVARRMLAGHRLNAAWRDAKCGQHMFGPLPGGSTSERTPS